MGVEVQQQGTIGGATTTASPLARASARQALLEGEAQRLGAARDEDRRQDQQRDRVRDGRLHVRLVRLVRLILLDVRLVHRPVGVILVVLGTDRLRRGRLQHELVGGLEHGLGPEEEDGLCGCGGGLLLVLVEEGQRVGGRLVGKGGLDLLGGLIPMGSLEGDEAELVAALRGSLLVEEAQCRLLLLLGRRKFRLYPVRQSTRPSLRILDIGTDGPFGRLARSPGPPDIGPNSAGNLQEREGPGYMGDRP